MRDIIRVFSKLIELLSYCILIGGYIKHIKISKELKKQNDTEIVSKKTLDELKIVNRLILIGIITAIVFRVIGILILHRII